jgi:ABC-type dipeptide/oligopeptide/nickel transport system permease component
VGNRLSATIKIWVPSLVVALVTTFPLLHLYGIEWNNVGHHLSYWLVTIIGLIIPAFVTHHILLALRLKSEFICTLAIYTVPMATYAPILSPPRSSSQLAHRDE